MDTERKLKTGIIINSGFAVFELAAGIGTGSLALVSDATHNLTDSISILIAYVGRKIAKRPATAEHTFGYGKATILTALINSLILVFVALYIFYEAYQRLANPQPIRGGIIALVAGAGILVNGGIALMFYKERRDLNMKSVFLNMAFDTLVSAGAVAAGIIIQVTGKSIADPLISFAIGSMLIYGSVQIVNQAIHVLLEGIPENLKPQEIISAICSIPNVVSVDNFHLWSIAAQQPALSCHIVVTPAGLDDHIKVVEQAKDLLRQNFGISHSTIEIGLSPTPEHEH